MTPASILRPLLRLPNVATDAVMVLIGRSDRIKDAPKSSDTFKCAAGVFVATMLLDMISAGLPLVLAALLAAVALGSSLHWSKRSSNDARAVYMVYGVASVLQCVDVVVPFALLPVSIWLLVSLAIAMRRIYMPEAGR